MNNKQKNKNKVIFDDFYYKLEMILSDKYFKDSVKMLLKKFEKAKMAIPHDGFLNQEEYEKWDDLYWNKFYELKNGKEYKDEMKEITKNKKKWDKKTQEKINKFDDDYLPPIYGDYLRNLLDYFKIDKKYEKAFLTSIKNFIFFKKNNFSHIDFSMKLTKNKETNEPELYIRIFGHTKKEDIEKYWRKVKEIQKDLPDYYGKNKEKEKFKRDISIYELYKKIKKEKNVNSDKRIDDEIWKKINEEYGDLEWENIRKIVSRMKKIDKKFVTSK